MTFIESGRDFLKFLNQLLLDAFDFYNHKIDSRFIEFHTFDGNLLNLDT